MAETWRVVLRDGSVREVVVYRDDSDSPYSVSTHRWCAGGMRSRTAHGAVVSAMSVGDEPVREILAPGEPTRAEAVAFERGRDAVDEAGARAMRAAALRDAVAAERERCARLCDEVAAERDALGAASMAARECAAHIRAGGV